MTTKAFDLPLVLPRGADCRGCTAGLRDELARVHGVRAVAVDGTRGLVHVTFDPALVAFDELSRDVRRVGAHTHCAEHCPFDSHDHGEADLALVLPDDLGYRHRLAHVTGLDCADCAVKLEGALRNTAGVVDASVSFGAATLKVTYDPASATFDDVLERVRRLGYDSLERRAAGGRDAAAGAARSALRDPRAVATLLSGLALVAGFAAAVLAPAAAPFFFAAAMALGGFFVVRSALYALRARTVDMNALMTLAAIGAAAIGEWSEAALVVFLFSLGNLLQVLTVERTRRAVQALVRLAPDEVTVVGDGGERLVPLAAVVPGDLVLVRPGERVPADGVVAEGTASVDRSVITGESLPIGRGPGDEVFAGSIVQGGALHLRATSTGDDTTVARIVHLVEEAQAERAPLQSTVDRFASRYTPVVVSAAAAVAFIPPLVYDQPWGTWFYRALALLIISCPCALVISTPVSILAALGAATRRGVLIKGGVYLEQARRLRAVAFDKTGTLTAGKPVVTDIVPLGDVTGERVLALAAACERSSEHPLAQAIVAAAGGRPQPTASRFHAVPGQGVRAEIDGRTYLVGKPELFGTPAGGHAGDGRPVWLDEIEPLEAEGKTVVVVGTPDRFLGLIAIADTLRPGTREALAAVRRQGVERLVMLTGDNETTARAVGAQAGVDEVRATLLPRQKVDAVGELRERYGPVAMVGDGVNDAPALAAASVGIAMGAAGTDAALETADIALMGDDLTAIADTLALSRRTTTVIWQNIVFSIAVKVAFLALAPLGLVTLWMAVLADMGTSLLVIGNGLRLRAMPRRTR